MTKKPAAKVTRPVNQHPPQATAYEAVQQSLGAPATDGPLQIDNALGSLRANVAYLTEMVDALLRRLEPATGELDLANSCWGTETDLVPLAATLYGQAGAVNACSQKLEAAVRALQF